MSSTCKSSDIVTLIRGLCESLIMSQEEFCSLDAKAGDGDLGITITYGCRAVIRYIDGFGDSFPPIGKFFESCGEHFEENTGSTFSTVAAEMFYSAGESAGSKEELTAEDAAKLFNAMADGVAKRGKVTLGDKTIYDALKPSADAFHRSVEKGHSFTDAMEEARTAAETGMESTKGMKAKIGRASWMGDKVIKEVDAGSVVWVRVMEYITEHSRRV